DQEEGAHALVGDDVVRHRSRQVGLPAAVAAEEEEPAIRVLGIGERRLVGLTDARHVRIERLEGLPLERAQAAHLRDLAMPPLLPFGDLALAGDEPPEVGTAHWCVDPQEASPLADGAAIVVAGRWGHVYRGGASPGRKLSQDVQIADPLHRHAPRWPSAPGSAGCIAIVADCSLPLPGWRLQSTAPGRAPAPRSTGPRSWGSRARRS